jgi:hypothetical protein
LRVRGRLRKGTVWGAAAPGGRGVTSGGGRDLSPTTVRDGRVSSAPQRPARPSECGDTNGLQCRPGVDVAWLMRSRTGDRQICGRGAMDPARRGRSGRGMRRRCGWDVLAAVCASGSASSDRSRGMASPTARDHAALAGARAVRTARLSTTRGNMCSARLDVAPDGSRLLQGGLQITPATGRGAGVVPGDGGIHARTGPAQGRGMGQLSSARSAAASGGQRDEVPVSVERRTLRSARGVVRAPSAGTERGPGESAEHRVGAKALTWKPHRGCAAPAGAQ